MSDRQNDKPDFQNYFPLRIPPRETEAPSPEKSDQPPSQNEPLDFTSGGEFYEIEYGSCPIPGVGKFVRRSQPIAPPERDPVRERFEQMRELARARAASLDYSRFFDRQVNTLNAALFYKQGQFMADFVDDFAEVAPFSQYFPYYQVMGYRQLRTYFTWRTRVRQGDVTDIPLSYAFLYVYELLSNIGVADPPEGLSRLMAFWQAFRTVNSGLDKYMPRWLRDYHVYYPLPHSFADFLRENGLEEYPGLIESEHELPLLCGIAKYDPRKSAFFTSERQELIISCLTFTEEKVSAVFSENGLSFPDAVFQPEKKIAPWTPFRGALFYSWLRQPDRHVLLRRDEIFVCRDNCWSVSSAVASERGRRLTGYLMKRTEATLRRRTGYTRALTADLSTVDHPAVQHLAAAGVSLEAVIDRAVDDFLRERNRVVVHVDEQSLRRIRREALATQEKLIVPEEAPSALVIPVAPEPTAPVAPARGNSWDELNAALTETERQALRAVLSGAETFRAFAAASGQMPEVLMDGINEKAADSVGDSLTDEDFTLYDDYIEQVKEMVT